MGDNCVTMRHELSEEASFAGVPAAGVPAPPIWTSAGCAFIMNTTLMLLSGLSLGLGLNEAVIAPPISGPFNGICLEAAGGPASADGSAEARLYGFLDLTQPLRFWGIEALPSM